MPQTDDSLATHATYLADRTPLSPKEAEAYLRHRASPETRPQKALAKEMGISEGTFSAHLSNAREKLTAPHSEGVPTAMFGLEAFITNGRGDDRTGLDYAPVDYAVKSGLDVLVTQRIDRRWPDSATAAETTVLDGPEYRLHVRYADDTDDHLAVHHVISVAANTVQGLEQRLADQLTDAQIPDQTASRIRKTVNHLTTSIKTMHSTIVSPGTHELLQAMFTSAFRYGETPDPITLDDGNVTVAGVRITPSNVPEDMEEHESYVLVSVSDDFAETNSDADSDASLAQRSDRHADLVQDINAAIPDQFRFEGHNNEYVPVPANLGAYATALEACGFDADAENATVFARNVIA